MKKSFFRVLWGIQVFLILCGFNKISVEAESRDKHLNFNNLTMNEGLSQGTIDDIFQDSRGYMWFATNDGLNMYNGYEFKVFKGDYHNENTIWPGLITSIGEDKYGNMWIGTSGGLAILNKYSMQITRVDSDKNSKTLLSNHNVWDIHKDSYGNMWVGTEDGLNKYNYETNLFERYSVQEEAKSKENFSITDISNDKHGNLLVGSNKGLYIVNNKTQKLSKVNIINEVLDDREINDLYCSDEYGIFVVLEDGNLIVIKSEKDIDTFNAKYLNQDARIRTISQGVESDIWIGTNKGVFRCLIKEKQIIRYKHKDYNSKSLVSDGVRNIFKDKTGLMWIGTSNGISIANMEQNFTNYQKRIGEKDSLSGKSVFGIYEDEIGNLWAGTNADGLNKINRKTDEYEYFKMENGMPSDSIWQVRGDGKGHVWVATKNGLTKINIFTNEIKVYKHIEGDETSLVDNDVREIFIAKDGLFWIGTRKGLCIFNPETEKFISLNNVLNDNGINELFVRRIFQDSNGDIWLAVGWQSGLVKLEINNKKLIRYTTEGSEGKFLSDNVVMAINQGLNGDMWIATINGLNRIDSKTKKIKIYNREDGLENSYIYGILVDDEGNIWVSSNGGIYKFNVKLNSFENYTYVDGLQNNEFNVVSDFKSSKGELFFGGVNGITSFMPNDINKIKKESLPIYINNLSVGRESKSIFEKNLKLKYKENNFEFLFTLPEYVDPKNVSYEYMLEGFDQQWVYSGQKRKANYTNISPGKYIFKVRAKAKGKEMSNIAIFNLTIEKPWYLSNIALIIYFALSIGAITIALNYVKILDGLVTERTFELHKEMLEKEKMYEELLRYEKVRNTYLVNLSHELRTPLNVILSSQQLISSLNKAGKVITKEKLESYMKIISTNAKTLLEVINDLIDSSKIKSGAYVIQKEKHNIVYVVEEVALSMNYYIEEAGINLIVDPEVEELEVLCAKNEIERIVTNLIGNAVKFTDAGGEIFVGVRQRGENVEIVVKDSGVGISKDDQNKIFDRFTQVGNLEEKISSKHCSSGIGLNLVQDLVSLHNGTIIVISDLGKGSEFIVTIPINSDSE
ncbi:MAG: ligand-binding sensor domain-containing protein [Sarcina sp.]